MALFDNKLVQIAVVLFAFYVLSQLMSQSMAKENLEVIQGAVVEPTPLIIKQGTPQQDISNVTATSSQIPFIQAKSDVVFATPSPAPGSTTVITPIQEGGEIAPAPFDPQMFNLNEIGPRDLMPQEEPELFANMPTDQGLDQNFLTSAWQYGIQTSSPQRNQNQDLRKLPHIPMSSSITPFLNPTILPDLTRRSLADLE